MLNNFRGLEHIYLPRPWEVRTAVGRKSEGPQVPRDIIIWMLATQVGTAATYTPISEFYTAPAPHPIAAACYRYRYAAPPCCCPRPAALSTPTSAPPTPQYFYNFYIYLLCCWIIYSLHYCIIWYIWYILTPTVCCTSLIFRTGIT